jgi:exodeoxyribonuclease VIII
MKPKPGIYKNVPETKYHSWDAISKSGLSRFFQNPYKYKYCPQKETQKMNIGSAIDTILFDGEEIFFEKYAIKPDGFKGTRKEDKIWKKENEHLPQISKEEAENCIKAANSVQNNNLAQEYLSGSQYQLSLVWEDEGTGVLCKARPDIKPEGPVIADLKTTGDVSYHQFQRIFNNLKYHWQAAFYSYGWEVLTGEEIEKFVFICVEPEIPWPVEVYSVSMDSDTIDLAQKQIGKTMLEYIECEERNHWPLSSGVEREIYLPGYAYTQNLEE